MENIIFWVVEVQYAVKLNSIWLIKCMYLSPHTKPQKINKSFISEL